MTVAIKGMTDTHVTVAGWGVKFGGQDLDGETFTPQTEFMLDLVPVKPVLYDHAQRDVKHFIGKVTKAEQMDEGIWVEAELDRHADYVEHVIRLVEKGALGWSSGSVGHLTRREGGIIKSWPVVEWSLTPTPAEPRTVGVEVIKSLMESDPSFEALLPEAEAATSAASADDVQHNAVENPVTEEKSIVSEEKSVETVDYGSLLNEIKSLRSELSVQAPINAPAVNLKTRRGDDETKATAYYIRTGDVGALKASNNTDMNIGTNADGGFAVPTGHYQGIIERLSEMRIDSQLGVQRIPGRGTTVNVPVSAASPNVFVQTSEASAFDRDAPTLGRVQMTLVKYTKTIEVSDELMDDEDSNLMSFVSNQVGQAMALTYNSLLLTELRASGTAALTLDSATTIGQGEIPELLYKLKSEYRTNASWVLGPSAIQIIRSLTSSNDFQFPPIQVRPTGQELLWGYPVVETTYGSNVAASAKSMIFGNFSYVGVRDGGIQFMRNPYLLANTGQVALHYYFRVVYKVLQSEAIVYATHPSA